jgi:hypothetical protein
MRGMLMHGAFPMEQLDYESGWIVLKITKTGFTYLKRIAVSWRN